MHDYRKKAVIFLCVLLLMFFLAFMISYIDLKSKIAVMKIGIDYKTVDISVMILSFLAMIRVIFELVKIETHEELKTRLETH